MWGDLYSWCCFGPLAAAPVQFSDSIYFWCLSSRAVPPCDVISRPTLPPANSDQPTEIGRFPAIHTVAPHPSRSAGAGSPSDASGRTIQIPPRPESAPGHKMSRLSVIASVCAALLGLSEPPVGSCVAGGRTPPIDWLLQQVDRPLIGLLTGPNVRHNSWCARRPVSRQPGVNRAASSEHSHRSDHARNSRCALMDSSAGGRVDWTRARLRRCRRNRRCFPTHRQGENKNQAAAGQRPSPPPLPVSASSW